jgi:hypothetical protein
MEQNINPDYLQVCVWEGTFLGKEDSVEDLEKFFLDEIGCRVKYFEEVKTKPGQGGEGGRIDMFIGVHNEDTSKFAIPRMKFGIRWWEDVLGNGNGILYPKEILEKYPKRW